MESGRTNDFPRRRRLLNKREFAHVFDHPEVSVDGLFRVLGKPNELSSSRLGMAVSRKVDARAVGRNRLKRVVRECFRTHEPLAEPPFGDFVVLPRPKAASICNTILRDSLTVHFDTIRQRFRSGGGKARRTTTPHDHAA